MKNLDMANWSHFRMGLWLSRPEDCKTSEEAFEIARSLEILADAAADDWDADISIGIGSEILAGIRYFKAAAYYKRGQELKEQEERAAREEEERKERERRALMATGVLSHGRRMSRHQHNIMRHRPGSLPASQLRRERARIFARAAEMKKRVLGANINVDGWVGNDTISAWQRALGTTVDGVISGQKNYLAKYMERICSGRIGWSATGSPLVRAIQKKVGCPEDGLIGPATVKGIQRFLNVEQTGYFNETTARALQQSLNDARW